MALDIVTGHTDDGLVFLKFNGRDPNSGQTVDSVLTMEPDMAKDVGERIVDASKKAMLANKRPLIVGEPQTFKKR